MIDPKLLRQDFGVLKEKLKQRGLPENFDLWPDKDEERRRTLGEIEAIRALKNSLSPQIAKAKREGTDASQILEQMKTSSDREKELNIKLSLLESELLSLELLVPNLPDESVPPGESDADNRVEKEWGNKPVFSFHPKPHWEIAEALGIVDFERAAKLSGSRFAVYLGDGARLERALVNFMLEMHRKKGYTEVMPPLLVREETMIGSGQLPKFAEDAFRTEGVEQKLYLIPTAEVVLCNLHAGEILEAEQLPLYYTAYTPCFRAEAGSHGRDVRGLIRQHQFNKVELVKLTAPERSFEELEMLTRDAEAVLETLGLPYRRVTLCAGDMGIASAKTFDLEVWLPGLDAFREISSCSNTTDFQSRRTKTRYRTHAGEKPKFLHMLNGSGLAVGRTLVAILENYQQADGTVLVPEALRPYLGGQEVISQR